MSESTAALQLRYLQVKYLPLLSNKNICVKQIYLNFLTTMPTFRDNLLKLIHNRVLSVFMQETQLWSWKNPLHIYMFYFPPMLPVFSTLSLDSWQPVKRRYNFQTAVYLKLVWASAHRIASSHPETHLLSNFFCWYWWKSSERMTWFIVLIKT